MQAQEFNRRAVLLGSAASALVAAGGSAAAAAAASDSNPVTAPWTGPYGGVPPFDKLTPALVAAGFKASLEARRRELAAIGSSTAAPTFANTIEAFEHAGQAYGRVSGFVGVYATSMNAGEWPALIETLSPQASAAADEVVQDAALFNRIEAVWNRRNAETLTAEQQRLLWRTRDFFVRRGAKVARADQQQLAQTNAELATLYTAFTQKVLADENTWVVVADPAGLPADLAAAYAAAAEERNLPGQMIVANTRSSVDPFLTYSDNAALREKVWRAFKGRGDGGGANDTNALIARIMPLRAKKARLLGFETYADWKLGDKMAATPARAMELMLTVWRPAVAKVREDVAEMSALAGGARINPWDYLYYSEKLRKAKYDVSQDETKPYFQLDRMIEASMWMAERLYGLKFKEISGTVPVFHPDVRVWEVSSAAGFVGLFYGDYFARPGKRSGAWENAYRSQSRAQGDIRPIVSNNNNFVKGKPGEPVLISLDDGQTLFHEFGHAIHDLVSDVRYASLSGTNTATDFVETPSQIHEHWLLTPEIMNRFALHHRTGAPIPQALVDKINAAGKFNQGYSTVETLSAAIVDMKLHMIPDGRVDPKAFEAATLAEIGAPAEVPMRHRLPQFTHLFADETYAAGYYSYLWSDAMAADMWQAFEEAGDPWDETAAAGLKAVMAAGDSVDQAELFRRFRGRDPSVNALLAERGFPLT